MRVYTPVSIYWSCIRMTIEISYVSEVRYKRVNAFFNMSPLFYAVGTSAPINVRRRRLAITHKQGIIEQQVAYNG